MATLGQQTLSFLGKSLGMNIDPNNIPLFKDTTNQTFYQRNEQFPSIKKTVPMINKGDGQKSFSDYLEYKGIDKNDIKKVDDAYLELRRQGIDVPEYDQKHTEAINLINQGKIADPFKKPEVKPEVQTESEDQDIVTRNKMVGAISQDKNSMDAVDKFLTNQSKWATYQQNQDWGEVAKDALANIIPSSFNLAKSLGYVAKNPFQTAEGLGKVIGGGIEQAGIGIANIIRPMIGKEKLTEEQAIEKGLLTDKGQVAGVVSDYLSKRYGTVEGFKQALSEDPAGVASDLLTITSGGATAATKLLGETSKVGQIAGKVANVASKADALLNVGTVTKPLQLGTKIATGLTEGVTKVFTKLPIETQKTIKNLASKFGEFQQGKLSRESLTEDIANGIEKRLSDLSETGKEYQNLRKGNIVTDANNIDDIYLNEIKDVKIKNLPLEDRQALKKVSDYIGEHKGQMTDEDLLSLRHNIDSTIGYKSDVTTYGKKLILGIRNKIDELSAEKIPGLKELDAKYGPEKEFLKKVKKDIFNADGTLKDNAQSIIANLTNVGKEKKLARLEQITPGLEENVKALKAYEKVQKIVEEGGSGLLDSMSGLTTPIVVSVLKNYGKVKALGKGVVEEISDFINRGEKLNEQQLNIVKEAIQNTPKEEIKGLFQSIKEKYQKGGVLEKGAKGFAVNPFNKGEKLSGVTKPVDITVYKGINEGGNKKFAMDYYALDKDTAKQYGEKIIKKNIKIQKLADYTNPNKEISDILLNNSGYPKEFVEKALRQEDSFNNPIYEMLEIQEVKKALKEKGYDAIKFKDFGNKNTNFNRHDTISIID